MSDKYAGDYSDVSAAVTAAWDEIEHVDSPEAATLRLLFGPAEFRVLQTAGIDKWTGPEADTARAIIFMLAKQYLAAKQRAELLKVDDGASG